MSNNRPTWYKIAQPPPRDRWLDKQRPEPWAIPAPTNDNTAPPDHTSLLIALGLVIGACLGCAATIGAYALHLL